MANSPFSFLSAARLQVSGLRKILDGSVNEQEKEPLIPGPGSMQGIRVTIEQPSKRPSIFSFAYWFPSYSSSNRSVVANKDHAIARAAPSSSKGLRSWSNWALPSFAFMRKTPSEKEMVKKIADYCVKNELDLSMLQRDPTKELVSYQIAGTDLRRGEARDLLRSIFATIKEVRPDGLGFVLQNLYAHCDVSRPQEREPHAGKALTSLRDLKTLPIEKATGTEELITPQQFEAVIRKLHAYASLLNRTTPAIAQQETERALQKANVPSGRVPHLDSDSNLQGLSNRVGDCYYNSALQAFKAMVRGTPIATAIQKNPKLPNLAKFLNNELPLTDEAAPLLRQEVKDIMLGEEHDSGDFLKDIFSIRSSLRQLVQGFSPHGGSSATVLERMLHYCNVTPPDVAHVYNQGTDAMSALRYHQALIPFDSCVRATAAVTKGMGMTMQQIIDGDVEKGNIEAPQTIIIGKPPATLVFDRSLNPSIIYTVNYTTNTETKNLPYRIQETQAPIYIHCNDDRVALYEPVAIISSLRCQTSDENFGHGVTFVKKADQEGNNHWKLVSDKIIADFPATGKIDETNDASFFNQEKVLSDFASQLCYRLVKTMSKEEADKARRQAAATAT